MSKEQLMDPLSVSCFFLGTRQLALPGVIIGTHYCSMMDDSAIVGTLTTMGIEAVVGILFLLLSLLSKSDLSPQFLLDVVSTKTTCLQHPHCGRNFSVLQRVNISKLFLVYKTACV